MNADGEVERVVSAPELSSPSGIAVTGEELWVTQLFGSVVVMDLDYNVLSVLGASEDNRDDAWPNALSRVGPVPALPALGEFRSPHGIAAFPEGRILVAEWLLEGRYSLINRNRQAHHGG